MFKICITESIGADMLQGVRQRKIIVEMNFPESIFVYFSNTFVDDESTIGRGGHEGVPGNIGHALRDFNISIETIVGERALPDVGHGVTQTQFAPANSFIKSTISNFLNSVRQIESTTEAAGVESSILDPERVGVCFFIIEVPDIITCERGIPIAFFNDQAVLIGIAVKRFLKRSGIDLRAGGRNYQLAMEIMALEERTLIDIHNIRNGQVVNAGVSKRKVTDPSTIFKVGVAVPDSTEGITPHRTNSHCSFFGQMEIGASFKSVVANSVDEAVFCDREVVDLVAVFIPRRTIVHTEVRHKPVTGQNERSISLNPPIHGIIILIREATLGDVVRTCAERDAGQLHPFVGLSAFRFELEILIRFRIADRCCVSCLIQILKEGCVTISDNVPAGKIIRCVGSRNQPTAGIASLHTSAVVAGSKNNTGDDRRLRDREVDNSREAVRIVLIVVAKTRELIGVLSVVAACTALNIHAVIIQRAESKLSRSTMEILEVSFPGLERSHIRRHIDPAEVDFDDEALHIRIVSAYIVPRSAGIDVQELLDTAVFFLPIVRLTFAERMKLTFVIDIRHFAGYPVPDTVAVVIRRTDPKVTVRNLSNCIVFFFRCDNGKITAEPLGQLLRLVPGETARIAEVVMTAEGYVILVIPRIPFFLVKSYAEQTICLHAGAVFRGAVNPSLAKVTDRLNETIVGHRNDGFIVRPPPDCRVVCVGRQNSCGKLPLLVGLQIEKIFGCWFRNLDRLEIFFRYKICCADRGRNHHHC